MSSNIYDKEQKKLIPFAGNSAATAGSLDGLSDVSLSSPTDGQVLTYDATNEVWVNGEGAIVIESLGDIADVDLTNLEDGQTIVWDSTEEKWVPGTSGTNYTAGFGISIENDEIKTTDFIGTQAQWNALTSAEKAAYDFVHITDDASPENYSPGHAISDGTSEKTQREVLEFNGFDVTDDSVNGKTKVAEVPYTAGRGVAITNKEVAVDETIATTFTGTQAEWNALTTEEKAEYELVNITDDAASGAQVVVDEVTEGNMNAVTSNAVAEAIGKAVKVEYSTAEVDTGDVWVDGRHIFRRTFMGTTGTTSTSSPYSVSVDLPIEIDKVINAFGNTIDPQGRDSVFGSIVMHGGGSLIQFSSQIRSDTSTGIKRIIFQSMAAAEYVNNITYAITILYVKV